MSVDRQQQRPAVAVYSLVPTAWAALFAVVLPLLLSAFLARYLFGVTLSVGGLATDAILFFGFLIFFRVVVRRPWALYVIGSLLVLLFHFSHVLKIAIFGMPLLVSDVDAGIALLGVLAGWRKWAVITLVAVAIGAAVWAMWPKRGKARYLLGAASYLLLLIFAGPVLIALTPTVNEGALSTFRNHGGVASLWISYSAKREHSGTSPSADEVSKAVGRVSQLRTLTSPAVGQRNVHMVLLETLWDPRDLRGYSFDEDPWDPRFRALWKQGGQSSVLVPGFGGATANAEFEALCGMPSSGAAVLFEGALQNSMPCLPRLLREAGYLTVAHHPYHEEFWSRDSAYELLGFEKYLPMPAFNLDDMDGAFLSDASMFRQVRQRELDRTGMRPLFSYVVSLGSHYPYDRNREVRPDLVVVKPHTQVVQNYANSTRYTTAAFTDYLEGVLKDDPNALVLAFGDHAPVLDALPDPYVRSGLSKQDSESLPILARTPLVLVDGRRGPVNLGSVPLRALPSLMLSLLGEGAPQLPVSAIEGATTGLVTHEFLGRMLVKHDGRWVACSEIIQGCTAAQAFHNRLLVLRKDLMQGDQFALSLLGASEMIDAEDMTIVRDHSRCAVSVVNWGPKDARRGAGFNVQLDGSSAIWMQLSGIGRGAPLLQIGSDRTRMTLNGNFASATFGFPKFLKVGGTYPVRVICPGGSETLIGEMKVT